MDIKALHFFIHHPMTSIKAALTGDKLFSYAHSIEELNTINQAKGPQIAVKAAYFHFGSKSIPP